MAESLRAASASVTKQIPAILPHRFRRFCRAIGPKRALLTRPSHRQRFSHSLGLADFLQRVVGVDAGCAARPSRSAEARHVIWTFQLDHKVYLQESLRKCWLFDRPAPMLMLPLGFIHSPIGRDARPRGARPI